MNYEQNNVHISCGDAIDQYSHWKKPTVIVCDGPYGINGFPGDLIGTDGLADWYKVHVEEWNKYATPKTTLWFWCTEQGWASVHTMFEQMGWEFKSCNVWNKGLSHVAGNTNTKTISHLPIVTEVCVQYVKKATFKVGDRNMSMKEWLRYEWGRTGLPFSQTNAACGVVDAATRKYFTKCHLWYMPPAEAFNRIAKYANVYGREEGKPYFSIDGVNVLSEDDWRELKPVFNCPFGVTNVWSLPQLRSMERVKEGQRAVHLNQKPLELIEAIINMSSNENDVVWDPFAGLCTTAVACKKIHREVFCAEINPEIYNKAIDRIKSLKNETPSLFGHGQPLYKGSRVSVH